MEKNIGMTQKRASRIGSSRASHLLPCLRNFADGEVFFVLPCIVQKRQASGGEAHNYQHPRIGYHSVVLQACICPLRPSFARQTTPLLSDRVPRFVRILSSAENYV